MEKIFILLFVLTAFVNQILAQHPCPLTVSQPQWTISFRGVSDYNFNSPVFAIPYYYDNVNYKVIIDYGFTYNNTQPITSLTFVLTNGNAYTPLNGVIIRNDGVTVQPGSPMNLMPQPNTFPPGVHYFHVEIPYTLFTQRFCSVRLEFPTPTGPQTGCSIFAKDILILSDPPPINGAITPECVTYLGSNTGKIKFKATLNGSINGITGLKAQVYNATSGVAIGNSVMIPNGVGVYSLNNGGPGFANGTYKVKFLDNNNNEYFITGQTSSYSYNYSSGSTLCPSGGVISNPPKDVIISQPKKL